MRYRGEVRLWQMCSGYGWFRGRVQRDGCGGGGGCMLVQGILLVSVAGVVR